jgi:outer membrane protein
MVNHLWLNWMPVHRMTACALRAKGVFMSVRIRLTVGLAALLTASTALAMPGFAQSPTGTPAYGTAAPKPVKPARSKPGASTSKDPTDAIAQALPRTLAGALAATYSSQPALQAERAKLRATDEGVPQALSGWRPTVVLGGTAGYGDGHEFIYSGGVGGTINQRTERDILTVQGTLTQPLYTGGKTSSTLHKAESAVMAERANLIAQEEQSFSDTVNAYVNVIQNQQLLALQVSNEQVLAKQLQATNDRFQVGEITRTDVAQAEAALAGATAQRETAEGNLQTARATFQRVVGYMPPGDLIEPQPLRLPVKSQQEAAAMASSNNPQVVAALFNDATAKDAVDVAFSTLMPQVSLQGQAFQQENPTTRSSETGGYQIVAQVSVPLYQGGSEYSAVRQARQTEQQERKLVDDSRRTAVQNAVQAWETLVAARASATSTRSAIQANQVALDGVEREAIVGSRTTLDVLNAQQALLNSQTTLVQNLAALVEASYAVASAIGRLTARDLALPVPLYDEKAYYDAVRNKWFGTGDYATDQPAR